MLSEFDQLLDILSQVVSELLEEQESDEFCNNSLDFSDLPSIHCVQKQGVDNV